MGGSGTVEDGGVAVGVGAGSSGGTLDGRDVSTLSSSDARLRNI